MATSDGKKRRAEDRERRRAQAGARPSPEDTSRHKSESEAAQAARTAATAAAVGAAVGAVRALADRRNDESSERAEPKVVDVPEAGDEPEPDEREADEAPAPHAREPYERHGASPDEAGGVVRTARRHLRDLHGAEPESVSSLEQTPDGWLVTMEVVELRRVPDSTDLLATYEVELDDEGDLLGFKRTRRYYRAQADNRDGQA